MILLPFAAHTRSFRAVVWISIWLLVWGLSVSGRCGGSEPIHAYLQRDRLTYYSLETGEKAYVRRVSCDITSTECELGRSPRGFRLAVPAAYPIRIKEEGRFFWSLWPAERINEVPEVKIRPAPRLSPLPEFPLVREEISDLPISKVMLNEAATAETGRKVSGGTWRRHEMEQYPITAMFNSLLLDLAVVDGVPRNQNRYQYPFSPGTTQFVEWAKKQQPEFAKFGSYDLLPQPKGSLRLLLVMEGSENRRYLMPPSQERRMYELEALPTTTMPGQWKWRLLDHYASDFVEPFFVVDSASDRWFVTRSGRLHRLITEAGTRSIRRQPVRDEQPILILLEEPGNPRRCFAFTTNRWFELKEPLVYNDFALDLPSTEAVMPTLLRCAQEIGRLVPSPADRR